MNCESRCCPENCLIPCTLENCSDEHLTTFCPPPCRACIPCPPTTCCMDPCVTSPVVCCVEPCATTCEPSCKPNGFPCLLQYETLKHRVKCPPTSNCTPCQISRPNFKPIIRCKCPSSADACVCYETVYTKSYNNPCCQPTCWWGSNQNSIKFLLDNCEIMKSSQYAVLLITNRKATK